MALKRIDLRDFVIVDHLELDMHNGFSVLTGETGAGKSILIDALQLALGARADAGVVREDCARAEISVEFDCPALLRPWLENSGFNVADELLLRRTLDAQGKSRAWINGSPATVAQLREAADYLVDIHGQHAWATLTRAESVRSLLDAYAQVDTHDIEQRWRHWRSAQKTLSDARNSLEAAQNERERLSWQIHELEKLAPARDEWEALNTEHTRLANAQALLEAAQASAAALEEEESGALPQLAKALGLLKNQMHLEPSFQALSETLGIGLLQIEDAAHSLHSYLRNTEPDPGRLAELDARMTQWLGLARRYKRAPADLYELLIHWENQLGVLDAATDLGALETEEKRTHADFETLALKLGTARAKAAPRLAKAITLAMQGLGMQGGRFEVNLEREAQANAWGYELVEFMVAGHTGSSPRPISKVASGGELSRIALAIAVTTSQLGTAQTLVFDEVDSGIGGAIAETVGRLMKQLGRDRQVLAVTHLPQVAACADHHLLVSKHSQDGRTVSRVQPVSGEMRVAEVARMMGGEHLSGTTMAHAKEMLNSTRPEQTNG